MTKTITLAITGSISAYKAADITSRLTKLGYEVHVLMTQSACQFITPLTLQSLSKNSVHTELLSENNPKIINHIDLAKKTDLFLIAPATANTIAELSYGFANNIVTAVALALPKNTLKLIAPAMNTNMYLNPITQKNLKILKTELNYEEICPKNSLLACGDVGIGALAPIETIITTIQEKLV